MRSEKNWKVFFYEEGGSNSVPMQITQTNMGKALHQNQEKIGKISKTRGHGKLRESRKTHSLVGYQICHMHFNQPYHIYLQF